MLHSQGTVGYGYDAAGNRISRVIVMPSLRGAEAETPAIPVVHSEMLKNTQIKIYPNPTKGQLAVEITGISEHSSGEIRLTDMQGKQLDVQPVSSGLQRFDLSGEQPGMYLIRIRIGEEVSTWKIIKE